MKAEETILNVATRKVSNRVRNGIMSFPQVKDGKRGTKMIIVNESSSIYSTQPIA